MRGSLVGKIAYRLKRAKGKPRTEVVATEIKGDSGDALTGFSPFSHGRFIEAVHNRSYFPDEPSNARDGIFHPSLVMDLQNASAGGKTATFNFVLATA